VRSRSSGSHTRRRLQDGSDMAGPGTVRGSREVTMATNEMPQPYERPRIDERIRVGDPLIVGYSISPRWRREDEKDVS
jgi:hypothetical protein